MSGDGDRNTRALKDAQRRPENRRCADCMDKGPTYCAMQYSTFICQNCSIVHRELWPTARCKSVSMAVFATDEVKAMRAGGNDANARRWMADWRPDACTPIPEPNAERSKLKTYLEEKYNRERWTAGGGAAPEPEEPVMSTSRSASQRPSGRRGRTPPPRIEISRDTAGSSYYAAAEAEKSRAAAAAAKPATARPALQINMKQASAPKTAPRLAAPGARLKPPGSSTSTSRFAVAAPSPEVAAPVTAAASAAADEDDFFGVLSSRGSETQAGDPFSGGGGGPNPFDASPSRADPFGAPQQQQAPPTSNPFDDAPSTTAANPFDDVGQPATSSLSSSAGDPFAGDSFGSSAAAAPPPPQQQSAPPPPQFASNQPAGGFGGPQGAMSVPPAAAASSSNPFGADTPSAPPVAAASSGGLAAGDEAIWDLGVKLSRVVIAAASERSAQVRCKDGSTQSVEPARLILLAKQPAFAVGDAAFYDMAARVHHCTIAETHRDAPDEPEYYTVTLSNGTKRTTDAPHLLKKAHADAASASAPGGSDPFAELTGGGAPSGAKKTCFFAVGERVVYGVKGSQSTERAVIAKVHHDAGDPPYYTIRLVASQTERQTDHARLKPDTAPLYGQQQPHAQQQQPPQQQQYAQQQQQQQQQPYAQQQQPPQQQQQQQQQWPQQQQQQQQQHQQQQQQWPQQQPQQQWGQNPF